LALVRILAIGDIHGCFPALTALEKYVPFTPSDKLVTLGDYIDRGPDSRAVLDWLIAHKREDRLIPIRGNHELMMCAARESDRYFDAWVAYGGDQALNSYARPHHGGNLQDVPEAHWDFMERGCRAYFETDTHFFVHANVYPNLPLNVQTDHKLYWDKFNDPLPHVSGKTMVCGHTPQKNGLPRSIGHAICIDTWVYARGWLTCLDVESGRYWQANEKRDVRTGVLEPAL